MNIRSARLLLIPLALTASLAVAGCTQNQAAQEPEAAPQAPRDDARVQAAGPNQIEQARLAAKANERGPAVGKVDQGPVGGVPVDAGATAPAEPAPPPEDLPPVAPYQKMNEHMGTIFGLMDKHQDDCEKAASEVEAFAQKHKVEMVALSRQIKESVDKLSAEDQQRFRAWAVKSGQLILKRSMGTMMAFHQKCPEQMQRINKQVRELTAAPPPQ